jgi:hypothetical protein
MLAMSGFRYDGATGAVVTAPKQALNDFECLWATGTGWGTFSLRRPGGNTELVIKVLVGTLHCKSCEMPAAGTRATVESADRKIEGQITRRDDRAIVMFSEVVQPIAGGEIRITVRS